MSSSTIQLTNDLRRLVVAGNVEGAKALLDGAEGMRLGMLDSIENPMCFLAISQGHANMLDFLISRGARGYDKRIWSMNGHSCVHASAKAGHVNCLLVLERTGADLDEPDESGSTPLMLAASNGHSEAVLHLLKKGANPNAQTLMGNTAAMLAAATGDEDSCHHLRESGANFNLTDRMGHTAGDWASVSGATELGRLLGSWAEMDLLNRAIPEKDQPDASNPLRI